MKIRVGLFFGGNSVEHEISVITGLQAAEYIDKEKYEVVPVYITKDNRFYTGEETGKIQDLPQKSRKSSWKVSARRLKRQKRCRNHSMPSRRWRSSVFQDAEKTETAVRC